MKDISPPHVAEPEKPLRREVAMAYRARREAGASHQDAQAAAMAVYRAARPGEADLDASARVAEMIASAINVDPVWFWKSMPRGTE